MHDHRAAGLHLIVDGFVADPSVFTKPALRGLFNRLVRELDMTIIMGPDFVEVELDPSKLTGDAFADEGGVTGMCVISTSHVSIHCWPLRRCFSMDVFSCKDFDAEAALRIVDETLGVSRRELTRVERRFPEPPPI